MRRKKASAGTRVSALSANSQNSQVSDERRHYHSAREAFDCAYSILEPFFHPDAGWQGRSLHHVSFGLVHGNFPHLAHEEADVLLAAVTRVFAERNSTLPPSGS